MSYDPPAPPPYDTGEAAISRATVFVSDPSAEAERVAQLLRGTGYLVVDVPMSMLVACVAVQTPEVILVDADVDGAAEAVTKIRSLPGGLVIDVVLLGREAVGGGPLRPGLLADAATFFARPVDPSAVMRKIDALAVGASSRAAESRNPSSPPISPGGAAAVGLARDRRSSVPTGSSGTAPLSARPPSSPTPMSANPAISLRTQLSAELEALLLDADHRLGLQRVDDPALPTPEQELEAVLPAELLAALDEPLEEDDEDSSFDAAHARPPPSSPRSADRDTPETSAGRPLTPVPATSFTFGLAPASGGPGLAPASGDPGSVDVLARTSEIAAASLGAASIRLSPTLAPLRGAYREAAASVERPLEAPQKPAPLPPSQATVLGPGDAPRLLASAIAGRASGAVSFESPEVLRRVVLRDGDIVTAASSADDETLLAFITARGEVRRDQVKDLVGKIPPFGRHAGAALVGHGFLRQDQLWPILRAHAEWLVARTLDVGRGTARLEAEAPGRLRQEPSVFGGSSGAEVLVEVARRAVSPEEATRRLGGPAARVAEGPSLSLLSECALSAAERALLEETRGLALGDVIAQAEGADMASVLYILSLLGVITMLPAIPARPTSSERLVDANPDEAREADVLALDSTAVREWVRARYDLVCEADYFTLLGIARDATGYEVRRAFLELRRAFEPSRILTPELADLEDDVRTIVVVLDEAYEILRDAARRERYRRALGDAP